jgi:hypothetical protein
VEPQGLFLCAMSVETLYTLFVSRTLLAERTEAVADGLCEKIAGLEDHLEQAGTLGGAGFGEDALCVGAPRRDDELAH